MWDLKQQNKSFFLLSGPCVIESQDLVCEVIETLKPVCEKLNIPYVFKASIDKANRSSHKAFRGLGFESGLEILANARTKYNVPIVTDIHNVEMVDEIAKVVDVLQIPAFLCRQTDLIAKAMQSSCVVNIKKGQFLSPWDMQAVFNKARSFSDAPIWLCERGATFGYNNLVVDMRSLVVMRGFAPVVFDATHSVQLPGGHGDSSSGQREFVPPLCRAAIAVGIDGLFMETHPNPSLAMSDGPNSVPLAKMPDLLSSMVELAEVVNTKKQVKLDSDQ